MIPFAMTLRYPKPQFQGREAFSVSAELLVTSKIKIKPINELTAILI